MSGMDWVGLTPNERLIAEQAVMNFRALNAACDAAADGTVMGIAEQQAVKQGRDATRRTLEMSLQMHGADVEKKRAEPDLWRRNQQSAPRPQYANRDDSGGRNRSVAGLSVLREMAKRWVRLG